VDNNVNMQNSYERNNRQAFSMDTGLVVFGTSTDIPVGFENRSSEDIRSSELVNDRLMTDYTPRCCCGVQVNR
jgi:hypothetical protein